MAKKMQGSGEERAFAAGAVVVWVILALAAALMLIGILGSLGSIS